MTPTTATKRSTTDKMNRATVGVFEMGSTFKGFTTAMALNSGAREASPIPSMPRTG